MKALLLATLVGLFANSAFATSNPMLDRLSTKAIQQIETQARQKLAAFIKDPNFNFYGFEIDWNNELGLMKCAYLESKTTAEAGQIYDKNHDAFAGTCLIPYTSLHAKGYLTLVMTTAHKEKSASVTVMNVIYE